MRGQIALQYSIGCNEKYKTFVSNRVSKINGKCFMEWKYVPKKENPADLGSRGCKTCKLDNRWWEYAVWFQDQTQWPEKFCQPH